mgnify:CR=1 FL=1
MEKERRAQKATQKEGGGGQETTAWMEEGHVGVSNTDEGGGSEGRRG